MVKAKEWYANDGGVLMRKENKKKKKKEKRTGRVFCELKFSNAFFAMKRIKLILIRFNQVRASDKKNTNKNPLLTKPQGQKGCRSNVFRIFPSFSILFKSSRSNYFHQLFFSSFNTASMFTGIVEQVGSKWAGPADHQAGALALRMACVFLSSHY